MSRSVASGLLFIALASCRATAEPAPPVSTELSPQAISDQVHGDGHAGFFWLPPLVSAPSLQGTFDATQSPVVTITPLTAGAVPIATYTMTSGPGSETVRVDSVNRDYIVNWHTDQFALDPSVNYRIAVLIGGNTAGAVDVDVVTSGAEAKNVDTQQYVPLVDGRTLPIKWFMNACGSVFCSALGQCHVAGTCDYTTGTCSNPVAADGTGCNDGNACTETDACSNGACVGSNPVVCGAEDACHLPGTCDPTSGTCSNPTAADGTVCGPGSSCASGICEATDPCATNPCQHGGTCTDGGASGYVCSCQFGYSGPSCETPPAAPLAQICRCDLSRDVDSWDVNQAVSVDGSCSFSFDPARTIVTYEWDFDYSATKGFSSQATGLLATNPSGYPTYDADSIGNPVGSAFAVALRVTNDIGLQSIAVCDMFIKPQPHCPHAFAVGPGLPASSNYQATVNVPVQFDATGSFDPDGDPLTYAWNINDNSMQYDDAAGPTPSWTFASPGTYIIAVEVTDHPDQNLNPYSASECTSTDFRWVVVTQ